MSKKELIKKALVTLITDGPKALYHKTQGYIKKQKYKNDNYFNNNNCLAIENLIRNTQAIDSIIVDTLDKPRINLVTDSIGKESLFGGVATSIIIASLFAFKRNLEIRIITRDSIANPEDYYNILDMNTIQHPHKCTFFSDYNRNIDGKNSYKLEVSDNDIFIATSWWSAEAIRKTTVRKRFFYIIQEVETFFYSHGDEHLFCSQILKNNNIDFIVNSHYLWDYFNCYNKNICEKGIFFEPAFSKKIFNYDSKYIENIISRKKKNFFFYARPNNPRNLFHFGIMIIDEAIKRGIINTNEWDIFFVGQSTPYIKFCNNYTPISLGILSWNEYAKFLRSVDLTLSLMYTPHPSYPPYDAACSGSVVLTNCCLNKIEFEMNKNIIMSSLNIESFMEHMEKAIDLVNSPTERLQNCNNSSIETDWEKSLEETIVFLESRI